jgi:predicted phage replisome organizer
VIHDFPEGAEILLIWVKLLCMAGKVNANGYIFISENIPYTENSLASVLHSPLNTVKLALGTFENMGMITRDGKGIFINNFAYYQNQTALQIMRDKWANDKRIARHQAKQLKIGIVLDKVSDNVLDKSKTKQQNQAQNLNNSSNVLDKSETPLKDIDKELDIELDIERRIKNVELDNNLIKQTIPSETAIKLASKLRDLILSNNPKGLTPKDLTTWAKDIDRMIKIDKRTEAGIISVMEFSQHDSFWKTNILSAGKLREKFDQLYLKSKNEKPPFLSKNKNELPTTEQLEESWRVR